MKPLLSHQAVHAPKKPKGREERFAELKDEKLRAFARNLGCLIDNRDCMCAGPIEAAHVKSKGAAGGDWDNVVGLCRFHHAQQHLMGIRSFEFRHTLRMKAAAKKVTAFYIGKVKHGLERQ